MSKKLEANGRRDFIKTLGLGALLALPAAALLRSRAAAQAPNAAAKGELVKESDPTAQALGYKEDASKVDVKKFTKRAGADGKTQLCSSCMFFQSKSKDDKTAPCTIFSGKSVKAGGWCNTWAKKA